MAVDPSPGADGRLMEIYRSIDEVPRGMSSVVTIGKFDGVHSGHLGILSRLKEVARRRDARSVVITFDRNPQELFRPEASPKALASLEQKLELLAASGIDAVLVAEFTPEFAALSAEDFISTLLVGALGVREILVGADFRFGHRGAGDVTLLKERSAEYGFEVTVISDVAAAGRRVSSTWVRELLEAGDVEQAADLLGRLPTVRGTVVPGARRGRELGFPTANLAAQPQGFIPADGIYAGWLVDAGVRYPAAISVGSNPTFDGVPPKQVEAHLLDQDIDLYGHTVDVQFQSRIRGMVAFDGVDALIRGMAEDVAAVRRLLP